MEATDKDSRSNLLQHGGNDRNPRAIMRVPKESKPNQAKDDGTGSKRDGNKCRGGKGERAASFGNQGRRPWREHCRRRKRRCRALECRPAT